MRIPNPEPTKLMPDFDEKLAQEWFGKVRDGAPLGSVPKGYRRLVRNIAVDQVRDGKLTLNEYLTHFGR